MKTILVFPAGTALGTEIYASLHNSKHFKLIGVSSCRDNVVIYPEFEIIKSYATSPDLQQEIETLVAKHKIDLIIPAHDDALVNLKRHFGEKIPGSTLETLEICRSKTKTYNALKAHINTPKIIDNPTAFPIFIKPDCGQGSRGAKIIRTKTEYDVCMSPGMIAMEYLPGKEYTIDCFSDRHGLLRYFSARERVLITNGISTTTKLQKHPQFEQLATTINNVLKLRGAWFFQLKENNNHELTLLEVAARIAGSSGINRINGVNLTELTLWDHLEFDVQLTQQIITDETRRTLSTIYSLPNYNQLYIDLDDCLIINSSINPSVVAFALTERNKGKRINLLTRTKNDPQQTLMQYKLSDFFDEIIWIKTEPKSKYMAPNSLLIDDSFAERKEACEKGHNVLSTQSIE